MNSDLEITPSFRFLIIEGVRINVKDPNPRAIIAARLSANCIKPRFAES